MDASFRESRPILPKNLFLILTAVLLSTLAFMAVMVLFLHSDMPAWSLPVTAVLFMAIIVLCALMRLTVECTDDALTVRFIVRKVEIPYSEIIDKRCGELGDIRNYGSWNLKGVSHKTYSVIGDDMGVALKLLGKRVVVVSSQDAEGLFRTVRAESREERGCSLHFTG